MAATFGKAERLCSKKSIGELLSKGRWFVLPHVKCCWMPSDAEVSRIMVSVPKKFFKRAVRRNLLKRRLREAYRIQKGLLGDAKVNLMFAYSSPEIAPWETIREEVAQALGHICAKSE